MIGEYLTKASVTYNDVCGTVAGDFADLTIEFTDFLVKKGFDIKTFYPYSIKFIFGEPVTGTTRRTWVVILAVKKEEVGESMDSVRSYANDHENKVPTYRFPLDLDQQDFFGIFKRFEIDLGYHSKSLHDYHDTIVEDRIEEKSL